MSSLTLMLFGRWGMVAVEMACLPRGRAFGPPRADAPLHAWTSFCGCRSAHLRLLRRSQHTTAVAHKRGLGRW